MRYKLTFKLENEKVELDYRKSMISFIKLSLSEYDKTYYDKFYKDRDNIIKPYTFAVFFPKAKFTKENIVVDEKTFEFNISILDYETAIILYNAFNNQKFKRFSLNNNSMTLVNISMMVEKEVSESKVNIRFLSPLVVRSREDNKDYYYSYLDNEFENMLKINIANQISSAKLNNKDLTDFKINAINAKKVIVKFYEKKIECSLGEYELSANEEIIQYLYKSGMGSKHSAGFGMFQIV